MRIDLISISHTFQRYDSIGDWTYKEDKNEPGTPAFQLYISKMPKWQMTALVAVHEIVEAILCADKGITPDQVDAFDIERTEAEPLLEPGDYKDSPYYKQHQIATAIERILAAEMGINWLEYEEIISNLPEVLIKPWATTQKPTSNE